MINQQHIRNFSIIAHIDHGKSTLADRILEVTGLLTARKMKDQYLDRLELERERGITIKAQSVRIPYTAKNGSEYVLNLIDTPGHVDFSYEVSRSLVACEGALLVVDASQGVEAQSLANAYLALENNLEIVPVLNKIDLPSAEPERIKSEIEEVIGLDCRNALLISAKTGQGVPEVLERIVTDLPPPKGQSDAPLKALIFDSWYDTYQGVVILFRVMDGRIARGQFILLHSTKARFEVSKLGVFSPDPVEVDELGPGEVGFLCAGIKNLTDARVGDTITDPDRPTSSPCPGFKKITAMVYCGMYPVEPNEYPSLKNSLEKLQLNDAAFSFEPETSHALGFGFRCGFLGLLHMEIIQERLEREFQARLLVTAPSVVYKAATIDGETTLVDNPSKLPPVNRIEHVAEPYVRMEIHVPNEHLGPVLALCEECRGTQADMRFLSSTRVIVTYELPFAEIVFDFFDRLKSVTRGYASLDYEFTEFKPSNLVKLDILINNEPVDALSIIVHKDKAYAQGRALTQRLRKVIPRQLFEVVIQAAVGQRIIAKERIAPLRKNVTAKCYGGDISRKRKLLEKQKEGKRRMKRMGNIDIPQEAFLAVLRKE